MKRQTRGILIALTALLVSAAVLVPLSRAQAAKVKGALLFPKNVLSLPPSVIGAAMVGSPVKPAGKAQAQSVISGTSYHNDTSPALRDMKPLPVVPRSNHEANPNPKLPIHHKDSPDTVVQSHAAPSPNMPAPILNFDGIPFPGVVCFCAPPDTNGEVGLTQYVQIVNEGYQVFDKTTGNSVFGPASIASIWTGFSGPCEFAGDGDPVVLYDQLANRWIISQFADNGITVTDECIAVSTTSDATSPYNRYGFHMTDNFLDYPHLSVWPDAYYMSANIFNPSGTAFLGPQPFAFDRAAMLAGNPATFVSTGITGGPAEDAYLPADLDGSTPPPANAPATFVEFPSTGAYRVFHFHADFLVPANSTFTLFASPLAAPFTLLCPFTRSCVPQLGSGDGLDAIADRLMFRLAYRNFGDHEAVVGNFTVSSAAVAGIRWFELRGVTAGPVTLFQESTYQPDTDWRWMGSVAQDVQGNLALGFSASSPTIFPQIRYAGRLAGDPIGTLAQGEAHLIDGTGSQTDTVNRWGDYSDLTVDPVDDCTFWYTQEYYTVTSSFNWRTRIGNFKFPGCTSGPHGTLTGTVTDSGTAAPIAGASIQIGVFSTITNGTGVYSISLPVGTYSVTASAFGYLSQTVNGVVVSDGGTTTQDFALVAAPSFTVSGHVRTASGDPIPNATVTIGGTPIPPATTDAAGFYSFASVPQGTYSMTATAGHCNDPQTQSVTVNGNITVDFALPQRHDNFGYTCQIVAFSYVDGDTALPLSGDDNFVSLSLPFAFPFYGQSYNTAFVATNGYLNFLAGNSIFSNSGIPSTGTPNGAIYPFWDDLFMDGTSTAWTKLTGAAPNRQFTIEWRNVGFFGDLAHRVNFETTLKENGQMLTQYNNVGAFGRQQGDSATIGIEDATGTDALQFSFNEASITPPNLAILFRLPPSGFVQGHVTDANDHLALGGATVKALQGVNVVRQTSTDGTGFYRMQVPVGDYTIEASKTNYETASANVTIAEDATVTQDFSLRTPRGVVSPTSLELIVPANQTRTRTLTLSNTGGLLMTWDVQESGGGAAAPSTAGLQKNPDYKPNSRTTKDLYTVQMPAGPPGAPGDILRQWATGLPLGWGVGYDGHVWLSDVDGGTCGPTCTDTKFAVTGPPPITSFATPWAGAWPGDIAPTGPSEMCQVNVGGDNGIYCWDTGTGAQTRHIAGAFPWTGISQRGLAYRPDDDSFYIGGWNEGILYHVAGFSHATPGAVLNQCNPADPNISGLTWNPAVGQVWEATNSPTDTIFRIDPTTCATVSTLAHPNPFFNGAGLEMDEGGNLWMIGQNPNTAYLIDSGVPAFTDVPWLSESPTNGTIAPGAHTDVQVTVNTTGLATGVYQATLTFRTNSGRLPNLSVPVRLIVPAYQTAVNAGDGAYTAVSGDTWSADQAYSSGSWGYIGQSNTDLAKKNIGGTTDPTLYRTDRRGSIEYRFDGLPNGVYQLELKFAELQNQKPGQRLFDVIAESTLLLPALDISAEVGKFFADDKSFFLPVTDGQLNLRFVLRQGSKEPIINAIRVTHRPDH